ncbi:hypothetical protein [Maribacter arenosus]|uniref:DUF4625 domain-containing protein n=1 Tax=Maribacter arenosus TaxID=1854708 RepID=A0ABR7VFG5_9FLAO|nr:hypothetical protein [Maribacter arenosus]MBD0852379.1 hypothetical protein [Maribacter arenosus]
MKRLLFLATSIFIFILGCSDRDDELNGIQIRVKNVSSIHFDTIQVGGDEMVHANVAPDSFSDYLEYETAYRYAYIGISADGETYALQPIDFVGETPLPFGYYTYEIGLDQEGNVTLNFVID